MLHKCKTTILLIKYITFLVYFKFLLFYLNSNIKMYLNFNEFRTCIDFFYILIKIYALLRYIYTHRRVKSYSETLRFKILIKLYNGNYKYINLIYVFIYIYICII